MAVSEQTPYTEYTANGTTTSFALEFYCEKKEHLIVLVDDVEPVVGSWSLSNGTVVFNTAPENGKKITLQRNTPFSRTTDYQSYNNSFRPPAVNNDFDRLWRKLQELGVADWLLRLYVDRLHQQQEQKINDLKVYVDDRDDELRAYLMEEIRKQGVALDQLDEYYNYLMQRLAQIAVDKGWDASFVVDASGLTQQEINNGFLLSEMLDIPKKVDGSMVYLKSRLPPNYTLKKPFSGGGRFIYDSSKSNINDGGLVIDGWVRVWDGAKVQVDWFGADPNGVLDSTEAVLKAQQAITGRTTSDYGTTRKPSVTVEYGSGVYKQGDIPLLSCVNYIGQGKESTQIIPNATAQWVFQTVGSSEGSTITIPTRMIYNSISDMTIGYGYANSIVIANNAAGGIYTEATSWCRMKNVGLHGLGNTALKLISVFDADYNDVTIFNVGHAQLAPALIIDRASNSPDGSNATTFTRCHFEGNYQHFQIGRNSRHIYFNWLKMEASTIASTITDPQGVTFNDLELSTTSTAKPEITFAATSGYSPFLVEFNNPMFIGQGWYLENTSRIIVRINGGSSRRPVKLLVGKNYRIQGHYTYDAGPSFINVTQSILKDCEFKDCKTSLITDGSDDSIILGDSTCKFIGNVITGQGGVSDGLALLNITSAGSARVRDNDFGAGSEFAIRGASNANHRDNTAVTKMYSVAGQSPTISMQNKGNGLGVGSINAFSVATSLDTEVSASGVVNGSSLIIMRIANLVSAVFIADSQNQITLVSKSSTAEIVTNATGVTGDGKIYVKISGTSLIVINRTTTQGTAYITSWSAIS